MDIEFDPAKDEANIEKHGVSLARAVDMEAAIIVEDTRKDYGERRYRAFGYIDGKAHCLALTMRNGKVRVISLRRAHRKEMREHGL